MAKYLLGILAWGEADGVGGNFVDSISGLFIHL
jgi:hypothetical protein